MGEGKEITVYWDTKTGYAMVTPNGIICMHTFSKSKRDAEKKMLVNEFEDWDYWADGWACIKVKLTIEPLTHSGIVHMNQTIKK